MPFPRIAELSGPSTRGSVDFSLANSSGKNFADFFFRFFSKSAARVLRATIVISVSAARAAAPSTIAILLMTVIALLNLLLDLFL
jgi:hypothetical protein